MNAERETRGSYWLETVSPGDPAPAPSGDISVDVAGLSTAWELGRRGHEGAVLEADRIAAGVTGHTTAKLTALHTLV